MRKQNYFYVVSLMVFIGFVAIGCANIRHLFSGDNVQEEHMRNQSSQEAPQKSNLPKVLIMGDSIAFGYGLYVEKILEKEAIVTSHRENGRDTGTVLENLVEWVGDTEWDIIHFNWGLHDLCYRIPASSTYNRDRSDSVILKRDKIHGKLTTTLEQYEKNLDKIVSQLKKTRAKLIWATITVIPEKEAGRFAGDEKRYNDVAGKVMKKHGVAINDLYSLTKNFPSKLCRGVTDLHYHPAGYEEIAKQVAGSILKALKDGQNNSDCNK